MGSPTPTGVTEQIRERFSQELRVEPVNAAATQQTDITEFQDPRLELAANAFIDAASAYLETSPQTETAWLTQEIYQTFGITENNPDALNSDIATRMEALSEAVQSSNAPDELKTAASNLFTLSAESPADLLKLAGFVVNGGAVSGVIQANGRNSENDEVIRSRDAYRNAMSLAAMESARIVQAAVSDFKNNLLPNLYDKTPEETARLYREFLRGQTANLTPEESSDITVNTIGAAAQDPNLTPSQLEAMRQVAIEELTATYGGDLERATREIDRAIEAGQATLARNGSDVDLASILEHSINTGNLAAFVASSENSNIIAAFADRTRETLTNLSNGITSTLGSALNSFSSLISSFSNAANPSQDNEQTPPALNAEDFGNSISTISDRTYDAVTEQIALLNELKAHRASLELDASNPVWGEFIRQDIDRVNADIIEAEIRLTQNVELIERGLRDANSWYQIELDAYSAQTNEDGIFELQAQNSPIYTPGQYLNLASLSVDGSHALLSRIDEALGRELSPQELVMRSVQGRSSISEYEITRILEATNLEGDELEAEVARIADFIELEGSIGIIRAEHQERGPAPRTPEEIREALAFHAEMRVWNDIRNEGLGSISKEELMNRLSEAGISGEQLIISTEQVIADLQYDLGTEFVTGLDYPGHVDVPGLVGHDPEPSLQPEPMLLSQSEPAPDPTQPQQQPLAPQVV
ncbi:MAG: hypothetical protein ACK4VI_06315 [Alphaproteobacteria bacterium]